MECENSDNWKWFVERLHDVIGGPPDLAMCTDVVTPCVTETLMKVINT
jgi:hypothetical protein